MQYIRRRKIPTITGSADGVRTEIYGGMTVKHIVIRTATADPPSEFAVEVNGVTIIDCTVENLTRENGVRYGFKSEDYDAINIPKAILSFEDDIPGGIGQGLRKLTFIAKSADAYVLTVAEVINI